MELRAISGRFIPTAGATIASLLALSLTACSGHGDGGTGDPPSAAEGDLYGDGDRVDDVFGPAKWYDTGNPNSIECKSPEAEPVLVTGLTVVAVDDYDEVNDNRKGNVYAVQTPGKKGLQPYDGITLRTPSFTPPDLRLFSGEVIDARGSFVEFLGPPSSDPFGFCKTLPQIEGTVTYRFDGGDIEPYPLVPAEVTDGSDRWAVLKSYQAARPFIGMLVRVENVTVGAMSTSSSGAVTIPINVGGGVTPDNVPNISNELFDLATDVGEIPEGFTFASVTGVVTYFYGFKIAPRYAADFVR